MRNGTFLRRKRKEMASLTRRARIGDLDKHRGLREAVCGEILERR